MAQPTHKIRKGLVQASLFERQASGPKGDFTSQSVALQISYKKGNEFVNNNITIVKKNLNNVIAALTEMQEYFDSEAPASDFFDEIHKDHNIHLHQDFSDNEALRSAVEQAVDESDEEIEEEEYKEFLKYHKETEEGNSAFPDDFKEFRKYHKETAQGISAFPDDFFDFDDSDEVYDFPEKEEEEEIEEQDDFEAIKAFEDRMIVELREQKVLQ